MFKVNIAKCEPTKLAKVVSKNPTKTHIQKDILYLALEKDAIHKALACDKTEVKELTDTSEINELIASLKKHDKKPNSETMTENTYKVSFIAPKLDTSSNSKLEQSISAIKFAKSLNAVSESHLIYLTIANSDCNNIITSLTNQQKTNVDSFISFLRQVFGANDNSLKQLENYESIKQESHEPDVVFFNRLLNSYFESRGKTMPASLDNIDATDAYLVKCKFVSAANSNKVKEKLTEQFAELTLNNIAIKAKQAREAAKYVSDINDTTKSMQVMAVQHRGRSDHRNASNYKSHRSSSGHYRGNSQNRGRSNSASKYSHSRNSSHHRSHSRSQSKNRSDTPFRQRSHSRERVVKFSNQFTQARCYRCGIQGHKLAQCVASDKIVAQYRKKLDETSERNRSRTHHNH